MATVTLPAWLADGRYQVIEPLGRSVFAGLDTHTRAPVVFKAIPFVAAADVLAARREVAALRIARLPGVARLVDDVVIAGGLVLVLERAAGAPFPGGAGELGPKLVQLLETLTRLHYAGLVHGDLKPDNVLVDADGRVTVIDLGFAGGAAVDGLARRSGSGFTPLYAAPEVRGGAAASVASDLWSVGAMAWEALTGASPLADVDPDALWWGAGPTELPSIRSVVGDAPEPLAAVVDALLRGDPADRPASAAVALASLGGRPPVFDATSLDRLGPAADEVALRALFAPAPRFLHLEADAARALVLRAGDDRRRRVAELDAWVRTGTAQVTARGLALDHEAVGRLLHGVVLRVDPVITPALPRSPAADAVWAALGALPPGADERTIAALAGVDPVAGPLAELERAGMVFRVGPARWSTDLSAGWDRPPAAMGDRPPTVRELVRDRAPADRVVAAVDALGEAWERGVPPPEAALVLEWGLAAAREREETDVVARMLGHVAAHAIRRGAEDTIARAVALVRSEALAGEVADALAALLDVSRTTWIPRGDAVPSTPFDDARLELARQTALARVADAAGNAAFAAFLDARAAWADEPGPRSARWYRWMGMLRYREGAWAEAARLHTIAGARDPRPDVALTSLFNQASAWLDAGELDAAHGATARLMEAAQAQRDALAEVRAVLIARQITRRGEGGLAPDLDLARDAAAVSEPHGRALAVDEACEAWRRGDLALVAAIVQCVPLPRGPRRRLAREHLQLALAAAAGVDGVEEGAAVIAVRALDECDPVVAVQVAAALADQLPPDVRARAIRAGEAIPASAREAPRTLISVHRALHRLRALPPEVPCPIPS
jgi:serine/threonine-protein kinase